jgi:hypothetical protein
MRINVIRFPIVAAILGATGLASCTNVEYSEYYEVEEPISAIVVHVDRGHLELVGADTDIVTVERHIDGWEGNLDLETRVVDGVLYIDARCEGVLRCEVDSLITVPAGIDIDASVDLGDMTVTGLEGIADLSVNDGTLVAWQHAPIEGSVTVGVGSIDLEMLEEAPLSVAIGQGDVALAGETALVDVLGADADG